MIALKESGAERKANDTTCSHVIDISTFCNNREMRPMGSNAQKAEKF